MSPTPPTLPADLPARLALRLQASLPGAAAQRTFSPALSFGRHRGPAPADARSASVLVLLHRGPDGAWRLPLTVRGSDLPSHPGQVSLPGGAAEAGETPEEAALREAEEELGLTADAVRVLGRLSPLYVFASNFFVLPVVAAAKAEVCFRPHPGEVAEVLDFPAAALLAPESRGTHRVVRRGLSFAAPCWRLNEREIWGATAMILGELAAVLADAAAKPGPPLAAGVGGV